MTTAQQEAEPSGTRPGTGCAVTSPPPAPPGDRTETTAATCSAPGSAGRDLATRTDVHDLVVAFYREVVFDDLLAPVFGEVAEVDWAAHIPLLIDYWCRVLLGEPGYAGAILEAHRRVHDLEPLRAQHFDRWYALWVEATARRWSGPNAETARTHAAQMATVLARRLAGIDWAPPLSPAGG